MEENRIHLDVDKIIRIFVSLMEWKQCVHLLERIKCACIHQGRGRTSMRDC